jgi:hypothetical protein
VPQVGGILARTDQPTDLFDPPFTFVDRNIVAGGAMLTFIAVLSHLPESAAGLGSARRTGRSRRSPRSRSSPALRFCSVCTRIAPGRGAAILAHGAFIAAGQRTFTVNCVVCHGVDGRGNSGLAADLTLHIPYHNDTTLFIWTHRRDLIDSKKRHGCPHEGQAHGS